ncbi:MAG: hypothetical protein A2Y72_06825 [Chloroflexi bacterium RBG_13_53_26]|nr:MAG: hypothetical protein A2Y72_06825 [Chloroflexi bacterium RBG_13_53_26]
MVLTSIIAKGLALMDAISGYFATSTAIGQTNICGTLWTTYNAELTACGQSHILAELMMDLFQLRILPQILEALLAV